MCTSRDSPRFRAASRPRPVSTAPTIGLGPASRVTPFTTSLRVPSPPTATTSWAPASAAARARSMALCRPVVAAQSKTRPIRCRSSFRFCQSRSVRPPPAAGLTTTTARRHSKSEGCTVGDPSARRRRARGLLAAAARLGLGGRRRGPRQLPSLLVRDALALLDRQQVDQPRQRVAQQAEVALPVARGMRERPHLIDRQRERRSVALAGGQAQVSQDTAGAHARGGRLGHQRTRRSYSSRWLWPGAGWTVIFTSRPVCRRSRSGRPSPSR